MIRPLGRILFILYFNLTILCGGEITSSVTAQEILEGESVLLTIVIEGEEFDTLPNLPEIGGAKVLGSKRSTKSRIITVDGQTVEEQTSILTLELRPTHSLTIPAFQVTIDGELKSTESIKITIVESKPPTAKGENFSVEMNSTKAQIMVGEPLVVNVFFKQKKDIHVMSVDYTPPSFKAFFSKRVGGEERYDEGSYTVQKLTYLLIAKEEGNLTISPARIKVGERDEQRQKTGWFSATPIWSSLQSSELIIEAKKPQQYFDIIGKYHLEDSIDTQLTEPNKPVNLQLVIRGEGSLDEFEGLIFDIDGVTLYSDDAKIESNVTQGHVVSSYRKNYVFISDHDFVIPSQEIIIYDFETKSTKVYRSKSYKIIVNGGGYSSTSSTVYTQNNPRNLGGEEIGNGVERGETTIHWTIPKEILLLSFLLGGVLGLLLRPFLPLLKNIRLFRSKRKRVSSNEALMILYPHMNDTPEIEKMVRTLYAYQRGEKVEIDQERLEYFVRLYRNKENSIPEKKEG